MIEKQFLFNVHERHPSDPFIRKDKIFAKGFLQMIVAARLFNPGIKNAGSLKKLPALLFEISFDQFNLFSYPCLNDLC